MTAIAHKHAVLIKQWADAPEWWDVQHKHRDNVTITFGRVASWTTCDASVLFYSDEEGNSYWEHRLVKSAKHPDNIKPKKRLIDWYLMPRGTMTNHGEILYAIDEFHAKVLGKEDRETYVVRESSLRLKEQTKFTYWGGGECPVPESVVVECVRRDGKTFQTTPTHPEAIAYDWLHDFGDQDIIAYRITGLADGWTDNPEEVV